MLSTLRSVLRRGGRCVLGTMIASSKALQENIIGACSRQLMMMSYGDLDFKCLRCLFLMAGCHEV